jgi:3-hydroxyacyl-CoA dehydrogenase / enoyl-CoA hydratase / 3-hydroxybutyryl-CoA epimerase
MEAIRTSRDEAGIVTLTMDLPGKPVNTCSPQLLAELSAAVDAIEKEPPKAVIIASAKVRSFNAGADLFEIQKMSTADVAKYLAEGQSLFSRIAALPMPTVAAINGDCLGGGFELALACRHRVAADDPSINIGLPETKLGLIPAWGGTSRLPRTIGLIRALPILLAGKILPPRKAAKAGLVDEVVRPEALMSAARRLATHPTPRRKPRMLDRIATLAPLRKKVLESARQKTLDTTHGNYPAPLRLLDVVQTSYTDSFDAGLAAERQAILDMTQTDTGRNLLRLFFLRQQAKKKAFEQVNANKPADVQYAAVIGAGTMGAGIAHALIKAGIFVRLVEVNPQAASTGLGRIRKMLDDDIAIGKLDRLASKHAFNRVSPTVDWSGLELVDFVIEAVAEDIAVKRDVFTKLDRLCKPDCVLASNTSSLSITAMAAATHHPGRVVGLHFFNPVPKMPLAEIVRGKQSDEPSLATAIGLAVRIGKTPIVCSDSPGFVVNRILIPYLSESIVLAASGVPIETIDDTMKRWGMPMGPFELLDEIGLDIAMHVLESLHSDAATNGRVVNTMKHALDAKWLGKKTGRGFYVHGRKKPVLNQELTQVLSGNESKPMPPEQIERQLLSPMIAEMNRLLDEHVTDSTDTVDLATVLGLGLAPFRGGLASYARTVPSRSTDFQSVPHDVQQSETELKHAHV